MVSMTRLSRTFLAVGLPLTAQATLAGYTFEDGNLKGEVNVTAGGAAIFTRNVNFGAGRVDMRSRKNGGSKIDWQEFYVKPGVKLEYALQPDFSLLAGGSLVGATTFGDGDAGGFTRSSDGEVASEELYGGFRAGEWTFTAGRQNYMIGTGFIVMDGNLDQLKDGAYWLAPRSAFKDSAVLAWDHGALKTQAFTLRTDDDLGDFRMTGANLDYNLDDQVTLGAMAMKVNALGPRGATPLRRDGMQVYNLRALNARIPGLPALTLNAEYALERGNGEGVEYDAKAWYGQADYAFDALPLTPVVGYRYASFSGDDNLRDNRQESWDPLSKGYVDWGTWLVGDVVGNYLLFNSNENVQQFSIKTHLNETLNLGAIHYQFWLDEKNYMGTAVSDRRFADESVVFLDWAPSKALVSSLSYNWVKPMAAAKQVFGNDRKFSALELSFTYRY
ncbi:MULTISPECIES: alginate export family protein [unclassified Pseudomonas]|uniref:alginate export family protein n=1 Tax=unclassified Pseudomonas TaxID=196821 RepID=UPI0011A4CBD0|nr:MULTISPECIES: alginate export family protein [unclassified Pseudomonas]TWC13425.1 alginate export protein [Pseudomonas sp. SJZ075]TWC29723.1 alginate export protein [Pseudomonas sp. SJZ078]TWC50409.1 alginate export protein [Pseudomonas sp. SJZ124]TWC86091.1 alginate export protein [Pseudomonas sp. SJZ101]